METINKHMFIAYTEMKLQSGLISVKNTIFMWQNSPPLRTPASPCTACQVYHGLEERLKGFREALPLLMDLKHDAMRDRHWRRLMKETGIEFDMNPDTFTLQNIFAMELSRFVDDIAEILNTAIKEAAIEKGIKYDTYYLLRLTLSLSTTQFSF